MKSVETTLNREKIIDEFINSDFWNFMKFELAELKEGEASILLDYRSELNNIQGILHGGAIMSLVDTTMGMTARSLGADTVATIQLEVRFIAPVRSGQLRATASVIQVVKNTCILECRVTDIDGKMVAFSTSTFKKL